MTAFRLGRLDVQLVLGTPTRVMMSGRIDDSCNLGGLASEIPPGDVVIDTASVVFINSIGLREWIRFLRALGERPVTLERVADVMMTQMNIISDAARGTRIASFHAQYACPACGAETAPVVDAVVHAQLLAQMQAPRLPCPECGSAMELGDFAERYLTIFQSP